VRSEQKRAQAVCHQNQKAASACGAEGTSSAARSPLSEIHQKTMLSKMLASGGRFGYVIFR
jgi:hypothetical protein